MKCDALNRHSSLPLSTGGGSSLFGGMVSDVDSGVGGGEGVKLGLVVGVNAGVGIGVGA